MSAKINPTATAEVPHAVQAWVPGQATTTATNKGGRRPTMQELDDAKFVKSCTIDKQSKDHMYASYCASLAAVPAAPAIAAVAAVATVAAVALPPLTSSSSFLLCRSPGTTWTATASSTRSRSS
jgi:hypothetical protein